MTDDDARLITLDELAERLGVSHSTLRKLRRTADDGRQYYDIYGTRVARLHRGGKSTVLVPLADVATAIRNATMADDK